MCSSSSCIVVNVNVLQREFLFKPIRVNKGTRTGCGVIVFRGDGFFLFYFFRFGSDLLGLEGVPSVWGIFYSSPFNLKVTF